MEKAVESIIKYLEFLPKYSCAALGLVSVVLFVPDDAAKYTGFDEIRTTYKGPLWMALIVSAFFFIASIRSLAWRFVVCPFRKLIFPVQDRKTGIKQSRMRYQLLEFTKHSDPKKKILVYKESDSNGVSETYYDCRGNRFILDESYRVILEGSFSGSVIDPENYHFPRWGRIDWRDIVNGDIKSGCWAIEYR